MNRKSGTRGKGLISGNIPLCIGQSDSGTGYLQKFYGLCPVNKMLLERVRRVINVVNCRKCELVVNYLKSAVK
jgi:hypothetical protein